MLATGFTNSFTSGEICEDAWDRVDIQPVSKGCELAQNFAVTIQGPLRKRRGFWLNGTVADQTQPTRLIPFRKSVTDALMLEFGNLSGRIWQPNGQPLLNNGAQVTFAHPYTAAQLAGLRYKQVADVIYFRHNTGLAPWALTRNSNTSWSGAYESFTNGPWLPENFDTTQTISIGGAAPINDANTLTGASYTPIGQVITLTYNGGSPPFDANMVGAYVRLRQNPGLGAGIASWAAGFRRILGYFCISVGNIYTCASTGGAAADNNVTNPPIHTAGTASDGGQNWTYIGDGAGIVQITAFISPTQVTGKVIAEIPFGNPVGTAAWSLSAYSNSKGWPRMWPSLREERLVNGATLNNRDMLDLTETAGFYPTSESYHPGQGTGNVLATDAIRRRIGDDSGEILWSHVATYLVCGTVSGEYLIAGSVLDEPLSPSSVTIKQLSAYGSADVYPARVHKGIIYVTRAGQVLRELAVDTSQQPSTDDLTILARHIADRTFMQLAWVLAPDETLWCRMADGGLACLVYHEEQQVRGWCTVTLPPATLAGTTAWICEDIVTLPGPGAFETAWTIWSRTKAGTTQRVILMQSQKTDCLFMDIAQAYAGPPVSQIGGLGLFAGETVTVFANGAQLPDVVVSNAGTVPVPAGTTSAQVGIRYNALFRSLRLNVGSSLNARERLAGVIANLKCAVAQVGIDGGILETVSSRQQSDIPNIVPKRWIKEVTGAGPAVLNGRDPRIVVQDDSAYDCVIYSLKPKVSVGG